MKIRVSFFIILLVFSAHITALCAEDRQVKLVILQGVSLSAGEITRHLPGMTITGSDRDAGREITVYYFSAGVERYSYSDNGIITFSNPPGTIKALVKLRKGGRLKKVFFVSSSGKSREEIIRNFAGKIMKILGR